MRFSNRHKRNQKERINSRIAQKFSQSDEKPFCDIRRRKRPSDLSPERVDEAEPRARNPSRPLNEDEEIFVDAEEPAHDEEINA